MKKIRRLLLPFFLLLLQFGSCLASAPIVYVYYRLLVHLE